MQMTRLTGEELLKKIKEMEDLGKSDQAKACGYIETREDGSQKINFMAFYEAIADARDFTDKNNSDGECELDLLPSEWKDMTEDERIQKITSQNIEIEILKVFSRIDEYKYAVALSQNTPTNILEELGKEGDYFVEQALILRCLPQEIRCLDEGEICSSIKAGSVEDEALAKLCQANSWSLREALASAPNASETTLRILLQDRDPEIQAIIAKKLITDDLKGLTSEDLARRIIGGELESKSLEIVTKSGGWEVRFAAYLISEGESETFSLKSNKAFAFRCLDALNRNGDLILGDDQKLIILRSGSAGDEDYTITLEKVVLDEDGDPEDYEQIGYYDNSLESLETVVQEYLDNDGLIIDIEGSLPA